MIHLHSQLTTRVISPLRSICDLAVNEMFAFNQMHLQSLQLLSPSPTFTPICLLLSAHSLPTEDLRSVFSVSALLWSGHEVAQKYLHLAVSRITSSLYIAHFGKTNVPLIYQIEGSCISLVQVYRILVNSL